ncbi:MAG: hypothetical protein ACTHMC_12295 [Pseudobacter sp.]|uniref:hypothetical protein n=1 Tax=Pseudobacter sp. TaxID=2045420 RepID=UPI003F819EE4
MLRFLIVYILAFFPKLLPAQDTIYSTWDFARPFQLKFSDHGRWTDRPDSRNLMFKNILVANFDRSVIGEILTSIKPAKKYFNNNTLTFTLPYAVELSDIEGQVYRPGFKILPGANSDYNGYTIHLIDELKVRNIRTQGLLGFHNIKIQGRYNSKMSMRNIESDDLEIRGLKVDDLDIDSVNSGLVIEGSRIDDIRLANICPDSNAYRRRIAIRQSRFNKLVLDKVTSLDIVLEKDSIMGECIISGEIGEKKLIPKLEVIDSYFKSRFWSWAGLHFNKLVFYKVDFAPDLNLSGFSCDTLIFVDCGLLPKSLNIDVLPTGRPLSLMIKNTDFQDVRFVYNNYTRLIFDTANEYSYRNGIMNDDLTSSTFQMLIEKFRREGKMQSLENVDLDFYKWKFSKANVFGKAGLFLNKIWWYYGYKKWLILIWSFIFISVFVIINYYQWNHVQPAYPIMPDNFIGWNKVEYVIVYTVLVFFSLRIDLGKLKYEKRAHIYLFFIQYLVGLICLFFIFNALVKLS